MGYDCEVYTVFGVKIPEEDVLGFCKENLSEQDYEKWFEYGKTSDFPFKVGKYFFREYSDGGLDYGSYVYLADYCFDVMKERTEEPIEITPPTEKEVKNFIRNINKIYEWTVPPEYKVFMILNGY